MTLNDVKPGDEVIYWPAHHSPRIVTVQRVTPAQIVIGGERFWKKDGYAVGSNTWNLSSIEVGTAEKIARIREREHRNNLARDIRQAEYSRLTTDQLERIYAILTERAAEEAANNAN